MDENDVKRLDKRIDNGSLRCDKIHDNLNKCLTEIKTSMARIEQQMISAFGELETGDTAFATLNDRISDIEKQQTRWKTTIVTIGATATILFNIILWVLGLLFKYLLSKGGI